ncbi:hypothetical protein BH10BAC5_BH10BAC5_22430 [soil metagenome]
MKKLNVTFLILAALLISAQVSLTGCNKTEQVATTVKDSTITVTPPVQSAEEPINQGQPPSDENNKAVNQKVTTTTSSKKERNIKNKKIGDDRHMKDPVIVTDPNKPLTIEEKNKKNTELKESEADAKRKEIERRKRLNQ